MAIDRCYCRNITFRALKELAERHGCDVDRLSDRTGVGTGCGMCLGYVRVMLATGRTELPVLGSADVERLCAGEPQPGSPAARELASKSGAGAAPT